MSERGSGVTELYISKILVDPDDYPKTSEQKESDFWLWEQASRDTIDVKRIYIDVAGDLVAGVLLSQIIFWFLPGRDGESKLRVEHDGRMWLAKERTDWWDECRMKPKQFDRASADLEELGLITKKVMRFGGNPIVHIGLNVPKLLELVKTKFLNRESGDSLIRNNQLPRSGRTYNNRDHIQRSHTESRDTSPKKTIPVLKVSEEYTATFIEDYRDVWPEQTVRDRIAEAENYYQPLIEKGKYKNINLCVRSWLRKDAERSNGNGQRQNHFGEIPLVREGAGQNSGKSKYRESEVWGPDDL